MKGLGSFQTDRAIFSNKIWRNVLEFRLFFFIYGNAVWHSDGVTVNGVFVGRGQFLRSYRQLQEDLAYVENQRTINPPIMSIQRAVRRLCTCNRIAISVTPLGTLFTVLNYEHYQGFDRFKKLELGTEPDTHLGTTLVQKEECIKKDIKNTSCPKYKFSDEQMELAVYFRSLITARKPDYKFSSSVEKWANEIQLMIKQDHRSLEKIKAVIEWAQRDSFWQNNILSPDKLRKQFDRLEMALGKSISKPDYSKVKL